MPNLIDLHVHSTASDGTMTPAEVVRYAKSKGLTAIALTDHDTVDGLQEAIEEGNKVGLEVIPGVELSAEYNEKEVHILGLFIDYKSEKLLDKLNELRINKEERNPKMIEKLNKLGFEITMEDVAAEAFSGSNVNRAHFAAALKKKGYIGEMKEAFDKYIGNDKPAFVKRKKILPSEAIDMIKTSSGIPIVAHPYIRDREPKVIEKMIVDLKNDGIEGIEVYHSEHNEYKTGILLEIAKRYGLLVSGGSDFHGKIKPDLEIGVGFGNLRIGYYWLEKLKTRLEL